MGKKKQKKVNRTWDMGNVALFGCYLMSHGIYGDDKEFLKKLMFKALTEGEKIKG